MEKYSACLLISLFGFQAVELQHKDCCFQTFCYILQSDKKVYDIFWAHLVIAEMSQNGSDFSKVS